MPKKIKANLNINNVPEGAYRYIIVTVDYGELWYYGSSKDEKTAKDVASTYEFRFYIDTGVDSE